MIGVILDMNIKKNTKKSVLKPFWQDADGFDQKVVFSEI